MAVIGERWEVYALPDGEGRRVVSFDVDALDEARRPASSSRRVVLEIPAEMRADNGMPAPAAAVPMRLAEESLLAALESTRVRCRLVARQTWRGVRELAFQVEDGIAFEKIFGDWQRAQRWGSFHVDAEDGWTWFDANVRPPPEGWEQIRNRAVVNQLLEAGTNPEEPHRLEHVFKGSRDALDALAKDLADLGFERNAATRAADTATFVADAMLDVFEITDVTVRLRALAGTHGVAYQGWGAAVIPLPGCP
ncbi:MAG TPA: ribonuclease E inhibitor RraB [bacterium]|nr:ribonuclease E inhibitor RraB [bacterium]